VDILHSRFARKRAYSSDSNWRRVKEKDLAPARSYQLEFEANILANSPTVNDRFAVQRSRTDRIRR
jgi:hypothetical protein